MLLPLGKMSKYALIFLELIKNYFCSEECTLYIHVCKHTDYTLSVIQIISYILQLQCTIGTHFNYRQHTSTITYIHDQVLHINIYYSRRAAQRCLELGTMRLPTKHSNH